jgi:hypothetical protein
MNNNIKTLENGDFEVCSLEEAEEFAKKRNYTYEWNGVSPAVNKQYTVEKCPWDDWKPTKDIV